MLNLFNNRGPVGARSPAFALSVVGGLAILLGAVLYVSYPRHAVQPGAENVPIIRADAAPVKTAPDSQGGMDIPNRESTVFNSMRGEAPGAKVENLLPQPEQPMDRSKVFAGVKTAAVAPNQTNPDESAAQMASSAPAAGQQATETPEAGQGGDSASNSISTSAPTAAQADTAPAAAAQTVTTDGDGSVTINGAPDTATATATTTITAHDTAVPAAAPLAAPAAAVTPPPAKTEAAAPAPKAATHVAKAHAVKGSTYVQLAALTDKSAASASWKKLQKTYPQLAGEKYRVKTATVRGKTYYRLQAGPLSAERAKSVCKSVNAKKAGACLVISG